LIRLLDCCTFDGCHLYQPMLIAIVEVHLQHHQVDFEQRFLALLQLMFFSGLPVVYIAQPTLLKSITNIKTIIVVYIRF
jgi:hypothetical protein